MTRRNTPKQVDKYKGNWMDGMPIALCDSVENFNTSNAASLPFATYTGVDPLQADRDGLYSIVYMPRPMRNFQSDSPPLSFRAAMIQLQSTLAVAFAWLAGAAFVRRQAITPLSAAQINTYAPFTHFAAAVYCDPSTTLKWNCGGEPLLIPPPSSVYPEIFFFSICVHLGYRTLRSTFGCYNIRLSWDVSFAVNTAFFFQTQ